jgi:hypothetical protein
VPGESMNSPLQLCTTYLSSHGWLYRSLAW